MKKSYLKSMFMNAMMNVSMFLGSNIGTLNWLLVQKDFMLFFLAIVYILKSRELGQYKLENADIYRLWKKQFKDWWMYILGGRISIAISVFNITKRFKE